jgi:ABC transporter substrate binding protein (PQQ-dependent alcohol dehydrogenase system)
VVLVADEAFDFARQVPYHTVLPRPVVGSIDLEPVAWHWTWERNGAPQVNTRFDKKSGRSAHGKHRLGRLDRRQNGGAGNAAHTLGGFAKQRDFILGDAGFDGAKGLPVGVRPWDHQVRQGVLLAAPYQVVASAPVEGFLHRVNTLDTLGDDEPETPCHLNK